MNRFEVKTGDVHNPPSGALLIPMEGGPSKVLCPRLHVKWHNFVPVDFATHHLKFVDSNTIIKTKLILHVLCYMAI